ncbi:Com family DNA-binding transcriptional regulator [Phenylobacterium ferrooxidans]|uniref:Com family DNA-binding transcriptional regulator n=1 Tax=Phenylobacterium ferrooxidans TaxID=2982689 RepID=UPI00366ABAB9
MSSTLESIRCGSCRALLLKAQADGRLEIKCRRCGAFNTIALRPQSPNPTAKERPT